MALKKVSRKPRFDSGKGMYYNVFVMYGNVLEEIEKVTKKIDKADNVKIANLTVGRLKEYMDMEDHLEYLYTTKEKCEGILYDIMNGTNPGIIAGANYSTSVH